MSRTAAQPSSRRFSITQLILVVPWVAIVIDAWSPIRDNSFLWHVRAGSLQIERSEVLTNDPFSFTMRGEPWLTQSWLAELLYGWAEGISGLGFVPWLLLIASAVTFTGIGLIAYRESRSVPASAFVLILSTLLLISFLVPRPVIFSFALFPLVILAWDRPRLRWATPFLFWTWASVHGSFIIGLAYVGLTLLARKEWKALPMAFGAGVATLLTAHGLGVLQMLLDFSEATETLSLLSEWRRPSLSSPVFVAFLGGIAFIVIGAYRRLIEPVHLVMLVPFLVLGFSSLRAVPPAWLAIVPLVALALRGMELGAQKRFSVIPALIFTAVVFAMPFLIAGEAAIAEDRFPLEAQAELTDVRTFHDDRVGGYLIWAEWPDRLVYIDDRAELYGERMSEFVGVRDGSVDWRPVFERDGIRQALLRTENTTLRRDLSDAGWSVVHSDDDYVLLRPG